APLPRVTTLADITSVLSAPPVSDEIAALVIRALRGLPPLLTAGTAFGQGQSAAVTSDAVVKQIDAALTGDARWRAHNLRVWGPESGWPPMLRNDTNAIITAARSLLLAPGTSAAALADALRPLNAAAQHQVIGWWRKIRDGNRDVKFYDEVLG